MPKKKKYYVNMPKLILFETLDHHMFASVYATKNALPSVTLKRAMEVFMESYNLHEDIYPMEQAYQTYYRMFDAYRELRKEE